MKVLIGPMKTYVIPISAEEAAKQEDDKPPPALRAELHIPQPLIDCYVAAQHHNDRRDQWKKKVDAITVVALIITAAATGIAANMAKEAVDVALANSHLDKRAWVGLGPIDMLNQPAVGGVLKVRVRLENSGESPALYVRHVSHLAPLRMKQGDPRIPFVGSAELVACRGPKPQWNDELGGSLLLPQVQNASFDKDSSALPAVLVRATTDGGRIPLSEQDMQDIPAIEEDPTVKDWVGSLFWVGCINYFDTFHEAHRTSFCLFYNRSDESPNGKFSSCQKGNDGD